MLKKAGTASAERLWAFRPGLSNGLITPKSLAATAEPDPGFG
jgi:hypothetical protein